MWVCVSVCVANYTHRSVKGAVGGVKRRSESENGIKRGAKRVSRVPEAEKRGKLSEE